MSETIMSPEMRKMEEDWKRDRLIADKDAVIREKDEEIATLYHTVVVTIGGVDYEGFPTSKINYLQRLRILLEKESENAAQSKRVAELVEGLRKLEWEANKFSGEDRAYCPACSGFIKEGHEHDNCWLSKLLREVGE
jgi:hypothetical protein